jgi:hypothetical protein
MRCKSHVRFGGRPGETDPEQSGHRAPGRPNHDGKPWSQGGRTDLRDGILLCPWHHHRVHDPAHRHEFLANGDVRFHKRR